jgi:hypothetical protein
MSTLAQQHSSTASSSQNVLSQSNGMATEISVIHQLNLRHLKQVMDYSKGFLDKSFPLQHGSHKDVASYVVYYQQLLAFFADGSTSGLLKPAQFVALSGHREQPNSVVLNNNGRHIELVLNRKGINGSQDQAGIDDIQLQSIAPHCVWFSMMTGQQVSCSHKSNKQFTCKDGGNYSL